LAFFFPAFSFTLIGHEFFERITQIAVITAALDGVTAGAVGLIGVSALIIVKSTISTLYSLIIFVLSLGASYIFEHKMANVIIIVASAIAGQVFFINDGPPPGPPVNVTFWIN